MPQQLDYQYEPETVEQLHVRALEIFARVIEGRNLYPEVQANVYNSILNMVGQVKVSPLAVTPRMDIPRNHG